MVLLLKIAQYMKMLSMSSAQNVKFLFTNLFSVIHWSHTFIECLLQHKDSECLGDRRDDGRRKRSLLFTVTLIEGCSVIRGCVWRVWRGTRTAIFPSSAGSGAQNLYMLGQLSISELHPAPSREIFLSLKQLFDFYVITIYNSKNSLFLWTF